jgi:hypothetical protein
MNTDHIKIHFQFCAMPTGLPSRPDHNLVGETFNAWLGHRQQPALGIAQLQTTSTEGTNTARPTNSCRNDWIAKSSNRNTAGLRVEAECEEHSFPISYHADWIASVVNLYVT